MSKEDPDPGNGCAAHMEGFCVVGSKVAVSAVVSNAFLRVSKVAQ